MTKAVHLTIAALVLALGCKSEIDGKTAATVSDPKPPTTATQPAVDPAAGVPRDMPIDVARSKIEWTAAKVTRDHQGGFKDWSGTVSYDADGNLAGVQVSVSTASVWTDPAKLVAHLKKADFLDVEKFPTSTFTSTRIEGANGEGAIIVTGVLDLHGVRKEISFPAVVRTEGSDLVATAAFVLMRFDFGVSYEGAADDLIKPEVLMKLQVTAPRPSPS